MAWNSNNSGRREFSRLLPVPVPVLFPTPGQTQSPPRLPAPSKNGRGPCPSPLNPRFYYYSVFDPDNKQIGFA